MAKRKDAWRFGQTNTKILGIGVTVAQQTLTLLVGVRFSHPQPVLWHGRDIKTEIADDKASGQSVFNPINTILLFSVDSANYCLVGDIYSVSTAVSAESL